MERKKGGGGGQWRVSSRDAAWNLGSNGRKRRKRELLLKMGQKERRERRILKEVERRKKETILLEREGGK